MCALICFVSPGEAVFSIAYLANTTASYSWFQDVTAPKDPTSVYMRYLDKQKRKLLILVVIFKSILVTNRRCDQSQSYSKPQLVQCSPMKSQKFCLVFSITLHDPRVIFHASLVKNPTDIAVHFWDFIGEHFSCRTGTHTRGLPE